MEASEGVAARDPGYCGRQNGDGGGKRKKELGGGVGRVGEKTEERRSEMAEKGNKIMIC